jgi:hypothetical protein
MGCRSRGAGKVSHSRDYDTAARYYCPECSCLSWRMKRLRDQIRNTTRTVKRTSGKCPALHMGMSTRRARLFKTKNPIRSVSCRSRILIVRFQFLPITISGFRSSGCSRTPHSARAAPMPPTTDEVGGIFSDQGAEQAERAVDGGEAGVVPRLRDPSAISSAAWYRAERHRPPLWRDAGRRGRPNLSIRRRIDPIDGGVGHPHNGRRGCR